jgi:DNA end-binding protein Ku
VAFLRSIWNGIISFGLINVPVKMFTATDDRDIHFRNLHSVCHTPIELRRYCPHCNEEVTPDKTLRAYEREPGRFVIITDEDLEAMPQGETRSVNILDFVDLKDIDPVFYERTYYLAPAETGRKAYALLAAAMQDTSKVAIGQVVLRQKQHLCALRVLPNRVLVLEFMYYPDEIRNSEEVLEGNSIPVDSVSERERDMAVQLVASLSTAFEPQKYRDTYRLAMLDLIEAKANGEEITAPPSERPAQVIDLMEALRKSLALVEQNKEQKGVS